MRNKQFTKEAVEEGNLEGDVVVNMGPFELVEFIENQIANKPDGRNKMNVKQWNRRCNLLIDEYNRRYGKGLLKRINAKKEKAK